MAGSSPATGKSAGPRSAAMSNSPPLALEIRGLAKRFERPAVDGLDLAVTAGEFYTLLGPNGAGKTTTLRMVTGLLYPDLGSCAAFEFVSMAYPVAANTCYDR